MFLSHNSETLWNSLGCSLKCFLNIHCFKTLYTDSVLLSYRNILSLGHLNLLFHISTGYVLVTYVIIFNSVKNSKIMLESCMLQIAFISGYSYKILYFVIWASVTSDRLLLALFRFITSLHLNILFFCIVFDC